MTDVTAHAPGTPSWVDIGVPDIAAAAKFYTALFGWETEDMGEEAGHYTMCKLRGRAVAAIGPAMNPGPPAWTTYITVANVDDTAAKIAAAGGQVVAPPMDVMSAGRMAVAQDPTGAFFAIWQAGESIGAEIVNEPGTLCWNELNTRDVDGAIAFYESVFGLNTQRGDAYNQFELDGKVVGGCMPMPPMVPAQVPANWLAYFAVDDIEASTAKAKELGAISMVELMEAPDTGRFSILGDPLGAAFAIIQLDNPDR
jgi:predicted enzyme related to lactoylglutathione lyase